MYVDLLWRQDSEAFASTENIVRMALWTVAIPVLREFHFYWAHRLLHLRVLYKCATQSLFFLGATRDWKQSPFWGAAGDWMHRCRKRTPVWQWARRSSPMPCGSPKRDRMGNGFILHDFGPMLIPDCWAAWWRARYVHSVHHRNVDPEPFSGLCAPQPRACVGRARGSCLPVFRVARPRRHENKQAHRAGSRDHCGQGPRRRGYSSWAFFVVCV